MAAFDAIKPGDVLYDVGKVRMGNTTMRSLTVWRVVVQEVDAEKRRALVSWNGNATKWWSEAKIKKLRRSPPKTRQSVTGAVVRA
jgi:hypothetical protein